MRIAAAFFTLAIAVALSMPGTPPASAQASDRVVVRVGATEIRESDLKLAEEDIGSSLQPGPPEMRREALLSYLIDVALIAQAAETQKLGQGESFHRRVAFARQKVLMEAMLEKHSKDAASDAAMKKLYDDSVAQNKPVEEVRASHILVETEDKAKEVLAKLKAGGDFAALAKAESKDPGSADGGDLGYFTQDQMVQEFAEAAFKMEKGALSAPVKTQFGWHIIKVDDKRNKPVPAFDAVKEQIESYLVRRAQTELVAKLRAEGKVERLDAPAAPQQKK
jgi:peptidyl-prolyl cis-trans isomerase C